MHVTIKGKGYFDNLCPNLSTCVNKFSLIWSCCSVNIYIKAEYMLKFEIWRLDNKTTIAVVFTKKNILQALNIKGPFYPVKNVMVSSFEVRFQSHSNFFFQ